LTNFFVWGTKIGQKGKKVMYGPRLKAVELPTNGFRKSKGKRAPHVGQD